MPGANCLPDTNAVIAFFNNEPGLADLFEATGTLTLCPPVYSELFFGALNSRRAAENLEELKGFKATCAFVGIDAETSEIVAQLRVELKRAGNPIPENDLWIADIAHQHRYCLITRDSHFGEVPGIERLHF